VTDFLDRLLTLWTVPIDERVDPVADFRSIYVDPVPVNGTPTTADAMVARARSLQGAFADLRMDVMHRYEVEGRLVLGFMMLGRHVGPLLTPLGTVPATGREISVRTTDILTVADGRVTDIWVMSDDLGLLTQLGAVALA
jgi:predicted ester cyclase